MSEQEDELYAQFCVLMDTGQSGSQTFGEWMAAEVAQFQAENTRLQNAADWFTEHLAKANQEVARLQREVERLTIERNNARAANHTLVQPFSEAVDAANESEAKALDRAQAAESALEAMREALEEITHLNYINLHTTNFSMGDIAISLAGRALASLPPEQA